jgi:hypothetical protein
MKTQPDSVALDPARTAVPFGDDLVFFQELVGGVFEGPLSLLQ